MAIICSFGVLLVIPVLIAIAVISLLKFGIITWLLPLLGIAATVYFLPFGFGNPYAAKLVGSLAEAENTTGDGFIVQLTLSPRIHRGWRAYMEDADDLGYLCFANTAMVYRGDAVRFTIPFRQIAGVQARNVGWRGLFVYGRRVVVRVKGLPNGETLEFADRSSWLLPTSRRVMRRLYERLNAVASGRAS